MVSVAPPERGWAGWAPQGVCLPQPCRPGLAGPEQCSETRAQTRCCDPSWRDSSGSERSPLAACVWGHRWPLNLHHSAAALPHSTEQHRIIYWFADVGFSEALGLATDFRECSRWMFQMSGAVSKSALSVKIHRHLLCLCWIVSVLHSSLQRNQKFWFQDKCHFWSICGMEIPSGLCFHSSLMQNAYLLVSYYLQLCFASFYVPAWKYLCAHVTCPHVIGAKNWTCCWQVAHSVDSVCSHAPLKAVRATQTAPRPTSHCWLSFSWAPAPGCCLWMSATSWLSGFAGDWLVVEVQYQGLSVSSSFHFLLALSAGWAAVSGTNVLWLTLFGLKMKGSPSE